MLREGIQAGLGMGMRWPVCLSYLHAPLKRFLAAGKLIPAHWLMKDTDTTIVWLSAAFSPAGWEVGRIINVAGAAATATARDIARASAGATQKANSQRTCDRIMHACILDDNNAFLF